MTKSQRSTPASANFSFQSVKYYGFVTFFVILHFSRAHAKVKPVDRFSRCIISYDVFSTKVGNLGVASILEFT